MGFFARFLQRHKPPPPVPSVTAQPAAPAQPRFYTEQIPDTLDLGWYYSAEKDQLQMAKIPQADRATHFYILGATNTGKTKLMECQIRQDITLGNGFCIISPHDDLVTDTIGFLACHYHETQDERIFDRVVVVDPTDPQDTVGFNVLEVPPGVTPIEQAQELIMVFKRIWSSSWGARMEELMRNSLISLSLAGLTLGHLSEFLTSQPFRSQVMAKVTHPIATPYFARFDAMSKAAQQQWLDPVTNKVNAFLADERINQMLSVPKSTINLREIMDKKKILLLKLNKGKLKESADLLGSLFMAKIQLAAFSRSDIPEAARVPFYLYIDEFQNFASDSFSVVLSEARKYRLSLILAHQTLAQIPPDLRSVILGNTGIQVYFRMNRKDAELLAKEAFTYSGYNVKTIQMRDARIDTKFWTLGEEWERNFAKLQSLPPRHCFIKHKIAGGMLPVQTASIEPAHQILGMSPEDYAAYLETLPFGKKYVVARASVTMHPAQTQSVQSSEGPAPVATPQLDEQQQAFLEFITEHPNMPISSVYKALAVSVWKGERLRDELKALGLLEELEVRTERAGAGRAAKLVIPTFTALEILGKEPPAGRGGAIHRYVQHLIEEGATAKGYSVQCEKALGNGGIVDVHVEDGQVRIAVEVAVISKPSRELVHIKHCLAAGYDKVVAVFVDEGMLERTRRLIKTELSAEEVAKIQLVHVSKLSAVV
jgi:hypothetical protein